ARTWRGIREVLLSLWRRVRIRLAAPIEALAGRIDNHVAERNPGTAHMFIINPLHAHGYDNLFATHPSTENRVAALQELAQGHGTPRRDRSAAPRAGRDGPWG
ncbi:hypothetical protein RXV88_22680, partial [Aestuariicoccus sp. MJ-SS9]|nr:hypothetical protein [Aestuariicoccus sp. MJ-SS9]